MGPSQRDKKARVPGGAPAADPGLGRLSMPDTPAVARDLERMRQAALKYVEGNPPAHRTPDYYETLARLAGQKELNNGPGRN